MISDRNEIIAWLAERKEAGKRINPDNAEVTFWWALTLDPYGVWPDITDREKQVGREYFAQTPGGDDGWVSFDDLPDATREELRRKMRAGEGEERDLRWQSRKNASSA